MEKIILFCKTFKGDLERFKVLYKSIQKHNKDDIPFYISVPSSDYDIFKDTFKEGVNILIDEDIVNSTLEGWVQQQLVKTSIYKLGLCEYYVCIDSDSYFLKDFHVENFLYSVDVPYMVMHENKQLFELTSSYKSQLGFDPKESFIKDNKEIMKHFFRSGKVFDYGPTPCVWRSKVWKMLDERYGIDMLLKQNPSEIKWYGEAVLYFEYSFLTCEPFFKCLHYEFQYQIEKQITPTEELLSENYLGVVMQSNWNAPLNY